MFDAEDACPYCNAGIGGTAMRPTAVHHPECPSQYRPRTAAHKLPLTNAAGNTEPPLETTPAESE